MAPLKAELAAQVVEQEGKIMSLHVELGVKALREAELRNEVEKVNTEKKAVHAAMNTLKSEHQAINAVHRSQLDNAVDELRCKEKIEVTLRFSNEELKRQKEDADAAQKLWRTKYDKVKSKSMLQADILEKILVELRDDSEKNSKKKKKKVKTTASNDGPEPIPALPSSNKSVKPPLIPPSGQYSFLRPLNNAPLVPEGQPSTNKRKRTTEHANDENSPIASIKQEKL